ncbi:type VII secretion protein EccB [Streptomyces sp. NBC_01216]|uniref:type VII secretion protein EccB n=1 Tax=Streptomyces sp. NBC_01216 TaxID=2903778 RepID=UPI002E10128D|nr:type VII secretion protein EccB [Streptomyces sp. NBC_01216]
MQSKRDQVQAHMFVMGRLTSALLRGDPDAPESPQGRTNRGVAVGVVIAVLLTAGSFVLGLFKPGVKDSWKAAGTLVVNKDTGSRYLYLEGRLRPVRNYASARLLAGAEMKVVQVGSRSLEGVPPGAPVGISGAPDTLPAAGGLDTGAWQVCSGASSGAVTTLLAVGASADGSGLSAAQALVVTGPDKADYLVWRGSRLRLDDTRGASRSLGYDTAPRVKVSSAFLNSLPAGPDLSPPDVPGRGGKGPEFGGRKTRIGQVFQVAVPGADTRYYLLREEGLGPLTATGAALLLGDPKTREEAYDKQVPSAVELGADALNGDTADAPGTDLADLPPAPPKAVGLGGERTACARIEGGGGTGARVSVALVSLPELGPAAQPAPEGLTPACVPVDRITVRPGGGALVRALSAGGAAGGTVYLVTDSGMKYRIATDEALAALGYSAGQARGIPSPLLAMLPTGPDLSPAAAVTGGNSRATAAPCAGVAKPASPEAATGGTDKRGGGGDSAAVDKSVSKN